MAFAFPNIEKIGRIQCCKIIFFSTITTTLSVYNGNTSLIEYIAAGTITGAMYKVNLGFAATLVGAALGMYLYYVYLTCIYYYKEIFICFIHEG